MLLLDIPTTWMHHLNKPENRAVLDGFVKRHDRSIEEFARFVLFIINTLIDTPAWNVAGTNEFINDLTNKFVATRDNAKNGKSSAYAQAKTLLYRINNQVGQEATMRWNKCRLSLAVSVEELQQLIAAKELVV